MIFPIKAFIFVANVALFKANAFDHKDQALWYGIIGAQCNLKRQSPIELSSYEALQCRGISPINLHNYNVAHTSSAELKNNGHTADLQLPNTSLAFLSGGPLYHDRYIAESVHFHWGSQNSYGCEHVIDNRRHSLEMHIVHRNSKYRSVSEATQYYDGLAVLGILFDVDPNQEDDFEGLNKIIDSLIDIEEYNNSTKVYNFILSELLGNININEFFTYPGSLTTPPCSQAVIWMVFSHVLQMSSQQIKSFRKLRNSYGELMVNNFRNIQGKGFRQVFFCRKCDL